MLVLRARPYLSVTWRVGAGARDYVNASIDILSVSEILEDVQLVCVQNTQSLFLSNTRTKVSWRLRVV